MSDESFFEFQSLETLESTKMMFSIFKQGSYEDGVFQRTFSQKFISDLYQFLEKNNIPPKFKFHSLLVMKEVIATNDIKFVGVLSNSTPFLEYLQGIGLKVDPKKPLSDKGKNLFPNDKQLYGNKYVNLVLEILVYLGKKFPRTSKGDPTRFRKILTKLQSDNVVLPQQLTYFPKQKFKQDQPSRTSKDQPKKTKTQEGQKPSQKMQKNSNVSFESLVRFSKNKIQIYMGQLQQAQEVEEIQKKIMSAHEILNGYLTKFQEMGDSVYTPIPGKTQKQFQQIIEEYLKIVGFLEEEKKIYEKEISRNQFASYYDQIKLKYQQIYPQTNNQTPTSKIPKPKSTINQKQSTVNNKMNQPSKIEPNNKGNYKSTESVMKNEEKRVSKVQSPSITNSIVERSQTTKIDTNARIMAASIFERIQNKSKSPYNGFKQIRKSLQKEKNTIQAHPPNRYGNNKQVKVTTKSVFTSNLGGSKINDPIFSNPPNPSPAFRPYQGETILPNRELQHILYDIKKEQGHRRFKLANLKNKSLLFENQFLQIGCKTQAIFQSYDGFDVFLGMELYFGNKSNVMISGLEVSYEGDQNCLIYTNPREITSVIDAQMQVKHQLMMVPIKVPFSFINMRLCYNTSSGTTRTTIALPSSILKLTAYQPSLRPSQLAQIWPNLTKVYKSQQFKLSHYIPPLSMRKYLPNMIQLTQYSQFSRNGSNNDYELGGIIEICDIYQAIVKIIVRPNLTVVVQVGAKDPSEDGIKYMRFYLESLQMLLQETNG